MISDIQSNSLTETGVDSMVLASCTCTCACHCSCGCSGGDVYYVLNQDKHDDLSADKWDEAWGEYYS